MNDRPGHQMLRLTVSGPAELVVQLPAGVPGGAPAEEVAAAAVHPLPPTSDDAALVRQRHEVTVDGWRFEVAAEPARRAALREKAHRAAAQAESAARATLRAQIPGRVTRVWVSTGDQVAQGDRLLAIEAMKMENEIRAPRSGTIEKVSVEEGKRVELNDELLSIA